MKSSQLLQKLWHSNFKPKKKKQNTPNNKIKPAESYAEKRIQFSPMEKLSIVKLIIVFLIIAYTFVTQYET